jgi:hypothetical protein
MAIFRGGKRVGPFDIRIGLPRGREYDNIPGDPRLKQRANPETTINRLRSAIAKSEGVARNSRFLVRLNLPKNKLLTQALSDRNIAFDSTNQAVAAQANAEAGTSEEADKAQDKAGQALQYERDLLPQIQLLCTKITMPSRTFNTSPYRIAGAPYQYPTQVQYAEVQATFIADKFLRLRQFFEVWQNSIYDNQTGMFNFYENYISNLDIFQLGQFEELNDRDSATYGVRLRECFPSVIGEISYDAGAKDQYVELNVTFQYRDWLNFDLDIDSTGKVGGLSSGTVKPSGGLFSNLPPELRRTGRQVLGGLKRSIPIGKVFGGKIFPPFTF